MTLNKIKLAFIIMILALAGCRKEKDELTLPVRIHLQISTIYTAYDNWIDWSRGKIGIQSVRFEGRRETGEDVFFESDPEMNLEILSFPASIAEFDLPQGIYNYMRWDITLKRIMSDELIKVDDTDSLSIGLVFPGSYYYLDEETWEDIELPIIFAIDDTELFSFMPSSNDIALYANKDFVITLCFNLNYASHSTSGESLDKADRSNVDGKQTIVISSNKNEDLYENLLYRLAQSTRVIIGYY